MTASGLCTLKTYLFPTEMTKQLFYCTHSMKTLQAGPVTILSPVSVY